MDDSDSDDFDEAPTPQPARDRQLPLDLATAELQFVDAIRADPQDFPLRIVYADWLEQHGNLRKAELVRLLSVAPREGPARDRIRELGSQQPHDWMAILSRTPIDGCEQELQRDCAQRWETLASTDQPRVRRCHACGNDVYFCAMMPEVSALSWVRVAYSPLLDYATAVDEYDGSLLLDGGRTLRERRALRRRPFET